MAIGLGFSKNDVDQLLGGTCRDINNILYRLSQISDRITLMQDADLTALGYSSTEVATIRTFITNMATLKAVFTGAQALTTPHAFVMDIAQFFGSGI